MARPAGRCFSLAILLLQLLCPHPGGAESGQEDDLRNLWQSGERALAEGDTAGAFDVFRAALAIDRSRARSWNYLGGVFFHRDEHAQALLHFKQAHLLDPRDVLACNNVGTAYEKLGQYTKAETFYLRAIEVDARYPVPYRNLGLLYADHLQRPERARHYWEGFLSLSPDGPESELIRERLRSLDVEPGKGGPLAPETVDPP